MGVKRGVLEVAAGIVILLFFINSAYSISLNELLSKYNFNSAEGINITNFNDFFIDRDNNGINDTLVFELTANNEAGSGDYIFVLDLSDDFAVTNESNKTLASGINSLNISFDSSLLSKNKFNYSIRIYNSSYNLKYRKDGIETKEYKDYEAGFSILRISDRKMGNSLSLNITINSTKNTAAELSVFLKYNDSILSSRQNASLSSGISSILVSFDNETIKKTHFKGNFNVSSIKIGKKFFKNFLPSNYYDYEEFASSSYISKINDNLDNGNLAVNFGLDIKENDDYIIQFNAYDLFENIIEIKNESVSLDKGDNNVEIIVNGSKIYGKKLNGPYAVKNIRLLKNNELADSVNSYITDYYTFNDFSMPQLPDLRVGIEISDDYHYGISNISLNFTLNNTGSKSAFNIFLSISDNKTIDSTEQLLILGGKDSDNSIKKYNFYFENASDFEMTAIADLNGLIEEINESNNALRKTIKINKKPSLGSIGDFTINETETIKISLTAIDANSDSLDYSINNSKFNNINNDSDDFNVFEWKTATTDSGNYTLIAAVSDGWLNDSVLFKINVIDKPEIDFDNDGLNDSIDKVNGEIRDVNTTTLNISIMIDGSSNISRIFNDILEVKINDNNISVIQFRFNFSAENLNLANITTEKQKNESFGFFIVKGIKLPEGETKTILVDKIDNSINGICIRDGEISSISEISAGCNSANERKVECDNTTQNGYSCAYNNSIGKYRVAGLKHSGIKQIDYSKPSSSGNSESAGSAGGGSSGGGKAYIVFRDSDNASKNEFLEENRGNKSSLTPKADKNIARKPAGKKAAQKEAAGNNLITGFAALTNKVSISKEAKIVIFAAAAGVNIYLLFFRRIIVKRLNNKKFKNKIFLIIGILINAAAFIVLAEMSAASWSSYNNDLANKGIADGTGYFPIQTANFSSDLYGMDFQPLVGDINNDGYNEIIIFSNDFLKIFDYELNLIDEKFTGTILGQPAIFNDNIIFNARQKNNPSETDYFFVYNFNNSQLKQKFSRILSNDADFGGIRCLNISNSDYCIFKDKINNINIVNLDSKAVDSYSLSNYNETRYTIPSIGDIDDDGNYEAVFWLDNNSNNGYGFAAFDLINMSIDFIVDDVFVSALWHPSTSALKGQPVLVDLNNDNRMEIAASVFYNDNVISHDVRNDWFTELFVYSYNGTKLFSKCEQNTVSDVGCNDGTGISNKWEGTNPFVLDYDRNGFDDICFIKDEKFQGYFQYMALNCYNSSGGEIAKINLTDDDNVGNAVLADMNNDGNLEIVTRNKIYLLNGTSILEYNLNIYVTNRIAPIPVDIDGNDRLDLIWTRNGLARLFIDNAGAIKVSDVLIKPENPSIDDSLNCQWKVNGNNKIISANASWHKNNEFYSSEIIACINNTLCAAIGNVPSSALDENDVWKCSVTAFENMQKSLPRSDVAMIFAGSAEWKEFNKNRMSYGIVTGSGYFTKSAINKVSYNSSGSDFQPMIADINNNGQNEVVTFSNNSLILFNNILEVIAQKQVGNLMGQFALENMDDDAFIEIIAVVNNSEQDNFTIIEFDGSDFKIEASFDVTPQNGYQDIRCIDFDNDNVKECIFRDFNGIVHSYQINATSASDDELNINISDKDDDVYASKINIAPSFVDFDRDEDLDALFWFNDNFAVVDANKNIILNADAGTLSSAFQNDPTLLGVKFVNLDKAADYEVAVAYKHDYPGVHSWRTEIPLSLFNSRGGLVFSKVIDFYDVNPCLNDNRNCFGYGSDLLVYDYNKDGFDDIGIYVEGAYDSPYGTFIKFFDRNGNEITSNKVEFNEGASITNAVLADMDSNNNLDFITKKHIYALDGTALYNFSGNYKQAIAADIDKNGALDVFLFNKSHMMLLLDSNNYSIDFFVSEKDISFRPLNKTHSIVAAQFHSNIEADADVMLLNAETMESVNGSVIINGDYNFTAVMALSRGDKVRAGIDYGYKVNESSEGNNFDERRFEGLPYVYVSSLVEPSNINSLFSDYIKEKLTSGYYTDNEFEADVKVYIGKNYPVNIVNNVNFRNNYDFGYDYGSTLYFDKKGVYPFNAVVGGYKDYYGKIIIMIAGNEVEGSIAGVKEFINRQSSLLYTENNNVFYVDDENLDAIKAYDYLHNSANVDNYNENNDAFRQIVKNSLYDTMFASTDKTVVSDNGIILRLRNLRVNFSSEFIAYLNSIGVPIELPVVIARGAHSNLTTWETLAGEIANEGRDVWLIEITGGPGQDCDDCPNYNFSDLTDDYWPALINAVLNFTGKEKVQYVGHSNGGRTGIVSLANGSINPNKIETFIGVGVPGAFEGYSTFGEYFGRYGGEVIKRFETKNHVTLTELGIELREICKINFGCRLLARGLVSDDKMSLNVDKQYYLWINYTNDSQIGINLPLNNFYLIQGWVIDDELNNISHDFIVTEDDEKALYSNIISSNKKHYKVWGAHTTGWSSASLPDREFTKKIIKDILNKKALDQYKSNEINST